MYTKRVNIFTHYENEDAKKKKITPPKEMRNWCVWHSRYCGPNHERFWIEEEARWMNSWEEYKYVDSQDYYEDKPTKWCGASVVRLCVICGEQYGDHINGFCLNRTLRIYYNKYTNMITGIPAIHKTDELYWEEREGRGTQ